MIVRVVKHESLAIKVIHEIIYIGKEITFMKQPAVVSNEKKISYVVALDDSPYHAVNCVLNAICIHNNYIRFKVEFRNTLPKSVSNIFVYSQCFSELILNMI